MNISLYIYEYIHGECCRGQRCDTIPNYPLFFRHCFHAALYCSNLVAKTLAETHSLSHLQTIQDLPMSLTFTSLVRIPGANGAQTQWEYPNSTQKDPGSKPDDSVYHCTTGSATLCEIFLLRSSSSHTLYTLGVTAEDGSAMRSSIRGTVQFGSGWNWQAGEEEDQKKRFIDVEKEDAKLVGMTEEV